MVTEQVKRVSAAVRAAGLKRTDFTCRAERTVIRPRGEKPYAVFGHALATINGTDAAALAEEHAEKIVAHGMVVSVFSNPRFVSVREARPGEAPTVEYRDLRAEAGTKDLGESTRSLSYTGQGWTFEIPPWIVDDVRAHVRAAIRPGREIVGRIVTRYGVAVRYDQLRNRGKGDGSFRLNHGDDRRGLREDEDCILVHSHPGSFDHPSQGDLKGAAANWLGRPYAIYVCDLDQLRVFILHLNRQGFEVLA